ncbi:MAG: OsmC family protein [Melioribacteraceae bacterium]|nr:OsmC family protein [Melioribacteraceae bacterium]
MATKIKIKNIPEGYQSIISNGKHTIIGDEPVTSKGTDLGLSPTELVLAGLAMCKVGTVRYIARKNNWEIGNVNAELIQNVQRDNSGLKAAIDVKINIEGNITGEQREELFRQADNCYVHRLLNGELKINEAEELLNNSEPILKSA